MRLPSKRSAPRSGATTPTLVASRCAAPRVRRRAIGAAALFAALGWARLDEAEELAVPIPVQAALLAKIAAYDRNLPARAGERVTIVILIKSGDDASARAGQTMQNALGAEPTIAGLPHQEVVVTFTDAAALAKLCKSRRAAILYLASGFTDDDLAAMVAALDGADVLTGGAVASFVPKGIVLGFDLVSGKPKLLVHLGRARRQHVDLSAEVLKLMRIYE